MTTSRRRSAAVKDEMETANEKISTSKRPQSRRSTTPVPNESKTGKEEIAADAADTEEIDANAEIEKVVKRPFKLINNLPISDSRPIYSKIRNPLSIKDSAILYTSLQTSRQFWIEGNFFELYWSKAQERQQKYANSKIEAQQGKPDKKIKVEEEEEDEEEDDESKQEKRSNIRDRMNKLCDCSMVVGPHLFDVRLFILKNDEIEKQYEISMKQKKEIKLQKRLAREEDMKKKSELKQKKLEEDRERQLKAVQEVKPDSGDMNNLQPANKNDLKPTGSVSNDSKQMTGSSDSKPISAVNNNPTPVVANNGLKPVIKNGSQSNIVSPNNNAPKTLTEKANDPKPVTSDNNESGTPSSNNNDNSSKVISTNNNKNSTPSTANNSALQISSSNSDKSKETFVGNSDSKQNTADKISRPVADASPINPVTKDSPNGLKPANPNLTGVSNIKLIPASNAQTSESNKANSGFGNTVSSTTQAPTKTSSIPITNGSNNSTSNIPVKPSTQTLQTQPSASLAPKPQKQPVAKSRPSNDIMQSPENTIMIRNLNSIARIDPYLDALMKIVASGKSSPQQIHEFQGYIKKARDMGRRGIDDPRIFFEMIEIEAKQEASKKLNNANLWPGNNGSSTSRGQSISSPKPVGRPKKIKEPKPPKEPKVKKVKPPKPESSKELKLTAFQERYLKDADLVFEYSEVPTERFRIPKESIIEEVGGNKLLISFIMIEDKRSKELLKELTEIEEKKEKEEKIRKEEEQKKNEEEEKMKNENKKMKNENEDVVMKNENEDVVKDDKKELEKNNEEKNADKQVGGISEKTKAPSSKDVDDNNESLKNEQDRDEDMKDANEHPKKDEIKESKKDDSKEDDEEVDKKKDKEADEEGDKEIVDGKSTGEKKQDEDKGKGKKKPGRRKAKKRFVPRKSRRLASKEKKQNNPIDSDSDDESENETSEGYENEENSGNNEDKNKEFIKYITMTVMLQDVPARFMELIRNSFIDQEKVYKKMELIIANGIKTPSYYLWYTVDGLQDENISEKLRKNLMDAENAKEKKKYNKAPKQVPAILTSGIGGTPNSTLNKKEQETSNTPTTEAPNSAANPNVSGTSSSIKIEESND
ncbi:Swc3 protein [Saccharomycopsis crataegensis]|uniref:Swc3 protein n=1 Tax=Saccharomycopsis crataegensis TaxID=43959 RepID=A0AAV5QI60_9ASCO|nr:Swc3 protein [Saccharomycopsis crataegensis]